MTGIQEYGVRAELTSGGYVAGPAPPDIGGISEATPSLRL